MTKNVDTLVTTPNFILTCSSRALYSRLLIQYSQDIDACRVLQNLCNIHEMLYMEPFPALHAYADSALYIIFQSLLKDAKVL